MASAPALAVTGSTGQLGLLVARLLAGAGSPLRLLVRDARRAPTLESAVPVVSSYDDPGLAAASLAGVKTLFMVSAAEAEAGWRSTAPSLTPRPGPPSRAPTLHARP